MPIPKQELTDRQREILSKIRQCEALRNNAHARRDQLILEAHKLGISDPIIGQAFGASAGRVWQIRRDPHTGISKVGKRRAAPDVQESS